MFLCVDIELSFDYKFRGAAAIEDMVVFAPSMADCVGVFKSNEFSCTTATTGLTGTAVKFFGATVLNNKVIFAPYNADCVGQYAPAVATTTPKSTSVDSKSSSGLSTESIVGIAVGSAFVAGLIGYVLFRRMRANQYEKVQGTTLAF